MSIHEPTPIEDFLFIIPFRYPQLLINDSGGPLYAHTTHWKLSEIRENTKM
jgi:hypothetical protein